MNHFIYILFFIFIGITINMTNNIALKYTINRFMKTKREWIILFSFFVRMSFLAFLFYLIIRKSVQRAFFVTIGIIIGRISLLSGKKELK